jgi:hypothetical protein
MELNKKKKLNFVYTPKNSNSGKLKNYNTFKQNKSSSNLNFDLENENKFNFFNKILYYIINKLICQMPNNNLINNSLFNPTCDNL